MNNRQAEHQATVLETTGKIDGNVFSLLIDPGATESFISYYALDKGKMMASAQTDFDSVEMASGTTQSVGPKLEDCEIDLGM